ncbi:MAG TPA: dihydrofolate reductase [Flavobacterium lutivivi]|nr:dihydrofolate reductase [Flavobacterium lutivivi]
MIITIAAVAQNNALGKDNDLLWHLPDDFKRFKSLTTGHYIIMGRKTFESFPKPLPNRTHIIITRQKEYPVPDNCFVASSLTQAIEMCPKNEDIYIIGGGEIYKQSMDFADKLEITKVHQSFDADTFFPEIDDNKWKLHEEVFHPEDEKHKYGFSFLTYLKK